MKKIFYVLLSIIFIGSSTATAIADPTYAVLDSDGNVTNIIVCGDACAGGTFDGKTVVPQVAADPVTGENRGGFWQGPRTTTYDHGSGIFTILTDNSTITNFLIEQEENGSEIISSATIYGGAIEQFTYADTIGNNLFTREGFVYSYLDSTDAKISVVNEDITEFLLFENRKNNSEIEKSIKNSNLTLLSYKIQTLISLLGSWVKP